MRSELISPRLERAFRSAAECHEGQTRKASRTPYFQHVAAVALVLARAGFDEDVVIAGTLVLRHCDRRLLTE
jgi:guanosine-3',5'-bis(diphosphate) 3'-pyrophosphohydrolase